MGHATDNPRSKRLPGHFIPSARALGIGRIETDGVYCTLDEARRLAEHYDKHSPAPSLPTPRPKRRELRFATRVRGEDQKPQRRPARRRVVHIFDLDDPRHVLPDGRWCVHAANVALSDWPLTAAAAGELTGWGVKRMRKFAQYGIIPAVNIHTPSSPEWRFHPETCERAAWDGRGLVPWNAHVEGRKGRPTILRLRNGSSVRVRITADTPSIMAMHPEAAARA